MEENDSVHPSVAARFKEEMLLIYDEEKEYRPVLLRKHVDFCKFYEKL